MAVGSDHASLLCVTGVTLFYRNDRQQPRATGFVTPDALNIRNTCRFHLLPDQSRAHEATHVIELARWTCWRRAENDGIVSMIEPLHFHDWLRPHRAGVVSGPLSKRSFVHLFSRDRLALDDNLSRGGNWQTSIFANDYGHGSALQPAHPIVFRDTARHFNAAR